MIQFHFFIVKFFSYEIESLFARNETDSDDSKSFTCNFILCIGFPDLHYMVHRMYTSINFIICASCTLLYLFENDENAIITIYSYKRSNTCHEEFFLSSERMPEVPIEIDMDIFQIF